MIGATAIAVVRPPLPLFPSRGQGGAVAEQEDDPYMGTDAVAELAKVTSATVREYLKRSRRRIREGQPLRPQDLPKPDITINRSPAWRRSTITNWLEHRPRPGRPASTNR